MRSLPPPLLRSPLEALLFVDSQQWISIWFIRLCMLTHICLPNRIVSKSFQEITVFLRKRKDPFTTRNNKQIPFSIFLSDWNPLIPSNDRHSYRIYKICLSLFRNWHSVAFIIKCMISLSDYRDQRRILLCQLQYARFSGITPFSSYYPFLLISLILSLTTFLRIHGYAHFIWTNWVSNFEITAHRTARTTYACGFFGLLSNRVFQIFHW